MDMKNIFWTGVALAAIIWVVTQWDTSDLGKLIRLGAYFGAMYLWLTRTTWGNSLFKFFGDE